MKRILSVVLLLLAVVGGLLFCDRATRRDDAERKFGSFFSEKQDIDVFFMGTSHVLDGVTPMELWATTAFPLITWRRPPKRWA